MFQREKVISSKNAHQRNKKTKLEPWNVEFRLSLSVDCAALDHPLVARCCTAINCHYPAVKKYYTEPMICGPTPPTWEWCGLDNELENK